MRLAEHPERALLVASDGSLVFRFDPDRHEWVQCRVGKRGSYMAVKVVGKSLRVHRLVLEAFVGMAEPGVVARHLNGDPFDNRVENLAWGTKAENQHDRVAHGTDCRGVKHPQAKLSEGDVRHIRVLASPRRNVPHAEIARRYDVTLSCVRQIIYRQTWKHIT